MGICVMTRVCPGSDILLLCNAFALRQGLTVQYTMAQTHYVAQYGLELTTASASEILVGQVCVTLPSCCMALSKSLFQCPYLSQVETGIFLYCGIKEINCKVCGIKNSTSVPEFECLSGLTSGIAPALSL